MQYENEEERNEVKKLLQENQRLLIENNQLLKRMRRNSIIAFILRMVWLVILIGGVSYVYLNYVKPNWENLEAKIENLENVNFDNVDIEGAKDLLESLKSNFKPPV